MPDISLLQSLLPGVSIRAFEETASTNRDARDWLLQGAQHGDLVIADRQTQGRGRLGRSFSSPDGGLYMTIVLRMPPSPGPVTTLCAVAVCRAIEKMTDFAPQIKWVNDVQIEGKKVCGILCEGVWDGSKPAGMIVGIGLNVHGDSLPEELQPIARSLYPQCTTPPVSKERFAAAIYQEIIAGLNLIPAHMAEYRQKCLTLQKDVFWLDNGVRCEGRALDVDEEGALLVKASDGHTVRIAFGEVSVRAFDADIAL